MSATPPEPETGPVPVVDDSRSISDAERRERIRRETEERIRELQPDQFPVEGGAPKERLGLMSATMISWLAMLLPLQVRTAFAFGLNFVFNRVAASLRLLLAWMSRGLVTVVIASVYWLVLGPTAVVARLIGTDDLRTRPARGSMFTDKEPADATEERFLRQY